MAALWLLATLATSGVALAKPLTKPGIEPLRPLSLLRQPSFSSTVTAQPATRGQDELSCGFLDLPKDFFLSQRTNDPLAKSGVWESDDGGTFVSWTQDLFAFHYSIVNFFVDSRLLFRAETVDDDLVQIGRELTMRKKTRKDFTVISLKDCDDVLLYTIFEAIAKPHQIEIYNRADQLVAWSKNGYSFPDQLHFYDHEEAPIFISQSPMISDSISPSSGDAKRSDIATWQVEFLQGYNSNSSLVLPQNRWVLAAAVQERAIRDAAGRTANGGVEEPPVYWWFMVMSFGFFALFVGALIGVCCCAYRLVYPRRYEEVTNPFLKDGSVYGALEQKPWGGAPAGQGR